MTDSITRRGILQAAAAAASATAVGEAFAQEALSYGPPSPFSFELLKERARAMAAQPYVAPSQPAPEIVSKIDYDAWGKIRYNVDRAMFLAPGMRFPVTFFHLGMFFRKSVEMNIVENGQSRALKYDPSLFDMPANSMGRRVPEGAGFAGFRVQEPRDGALDWRRNDWVAFLGAAYFRAIGDMHQYGLSARAVALDVAAQDRREEFPDFTRFYISQEPGSERITVCALLEGPSIVGASQMVLRRRHGVVMNIDQSLHLRQDVTRFGLAPLTSMYWFSETAKPRAVDWRPEVHDSDGLALWTGAGEHVWRPLNNPPHVMVSAFMDENPRGFGLLQRDREFDHYQDGVNYERRPSLWVEPIGKWGKGAVQLVEIPTDDEIHDNIVAHWVPAEPARAGDHIELSYRLHWQGDEPYPTALGRCIATRLGNGGQPGQPRPKGVRKFVVEFLGGPLESLAFGVKPEPVLSASRGALSNMFAEATPDGVLGHWRAQFDLTVEGEDPVELRCFLKAGAIILTETWAFQYHPF